MYVNLLPTICLGAFYPTFDGEITRTAGRNSDHLFAFNHPSDIFSPLQGKLIDRFGPRVVITIGTLMAGISWMLVSRLDSLFELYLYYGVVGGLGTGIVYIGVVGLMVRWFPEKRGFATGMVAAGYGMGAILTTFPVTASLATSGLEQTFWQFGIMMASVWLYCKPGAADA